MSTMDNLNASSSVRACRPDSISMVTSLEETIPTFPLTQADSINELMTDGDHSLEQYISGLARDQIKCLKWANKLLTQADDEDVASFVPIKHLGDLHESHWHLLGILIEECCGVTVGTQLPGIRCSTEDIASVKVDNLQKCFEALEERGVQMDGIDIEELQNDDPHELMALTMALMKWQKDPKRKLKFEKISAMGADEFEKYGLNRTYSPKLGPKGTPVAGGHLAEDSEKYGWYYDVITTRTTTTTTTTTTTYEAEAEDDEDDGIGLFRLTEEEDDEEGDEELQRCTSVDDIHDAFTEDLHRIRMEKALVQLMSERF